MLHHICCVSLKRIDVYLSHVNTDLILYPRNEQRLFYLNPFLRNSHALMLIWSFSFLANESCVLMLSFSCILLISFYV